MLTVSDTIYFSCLCGMWQLYNAIIYLYLNRFKVIKFLDQWCFQGWRMRSGRRYFWGGRVLMFPKYCVIFVVSVRKYYLTLSCIKYDIQKSDVPYLYVFCSIYIIYGKIFTRMSLLFYRY